MALIILFFFIKTFLSRNCELSHTKREDKNEALERAETWCVLKVERGKNKTIRA